MPIFGKQNEAHFDLGGYVNKQNCRIWSTENPHANIEKPTHPKRVTFFFENEQREAFTDNGDRYRAMLNEFLFEEDISNIWFQQDGAMCHTAEAALDVLRPVFKDRIISRRTDAAWPPRSCDLIPLHHYLYADKPETIDALKDNIRKTIGEIQLHLIDNVLKNWSDRVG